MCQAALSPLNLAAGILKQFRGQVPVLLRHPAGAHVIDDLWAVADSRQRNAMAAGAPAWFVVYVRL